MADVVIATENHTVFDPNIGIKRKVFAGQPVPPDLIGPYRAAIGESEPVDYDKLEVDDLQQRVEARGLEPEGTGSNGRVLKADLVAALKAADEK